MTAQSPSLVFICGFPSSGTDLLKNLLNAHPEVFISGEFPLLPALAEKFDSTSGLDEQHSEEIRRALVESDVYGNLATTVLPRDFSYPASIATIYRALVRPESVRWVGNKTPQNAENVDRLEKLFPGSRYILIVRDIRDVALSWQKKWGKDPQLCAHRWNIRMSVARKLLRDHASDRHLIMAYESLLSDHVGAAREACAFLGIEYDPAMAEYHSYVKDSVDGKINYGEPIVRDNSEKWRSEMSARQTRRIEEIAYPSLEGYGYAIRYAKRPRPLPGWRRAIGRARDLAAMIIVGNRADRRKGAWGRSLDSIRLEWRKRFGKFRVTRS